jgi:tetratricopeptide (TPR) repeat protein
MAWLRGIIKNPEKRAVLSWIGGGAVVAVGGIFIAVTHYVEHKDAHKEPSAQLREALTGQLTAKDDQIKELMKQVAALTEKLLKENPSTAPGAQQAIGAAVQSIAQGAEEGDPRLKQALGLLHENKIGEAVPLLEAFAKDTGAKIEKDRKEAAVAYRNLGAIAGLADPKRALEAYEKALALDPDDIQSLYWSGVIQIGYGDLKTAQTRLERVQELAKTSDQAFYKYAALGTLGDIKQKRGDLGGALQSYRGTISIVSRLAKSDSGNALWQRDLSVSYIKVGDVLVQQGNLPEALKSYQAGLATIPALGPGRISLQQMRSGHRL